MSKLEQVDELLAKARKIIADNEERTTPLPAPNAEQDAPVVRRKRVVKTEMVPSMINTELEGPTRPRIVSRIVTVTVTIDPEMTTIDLLEAISKIKGVRSIGD